MTALLKAAAAVLLLACLAAPAPEEGFVSLVRGNAARQFELVGLPPDALEITGNEIRLAGTPAGYFATREVYHDFVLRFDWRYDRPRNLKTDAQFDGNGGVLLHIQKPHKVWPRSIEVQLLQADPGHIFAIFGGRFRGAPDPEAQDRAVRPVGEWNEQEVTCRGKTIVSILNGVVVDRGDGADPDRGPIGWQSEGTPIHFRNLRIKRLD